jgi:hypothetical protein
LGVVVIIPFSLFSFFFLSLFVCLTDCLSL